MHHAETHTAFDNLLRNTTNERVLDIFRKKYGTNPEWFGIPFDMWKYILLKYLNQHEFYRFMSCNRELRRLYQQGKYPGAFLRVSGKKWDAYRAWLVDYSEHAETKGKYTSVTLRIRVPELRGGIKTSICNVVSEQNLGGFVRMVACQEDSVMLDVVLQGRNPRNCAKKLVKLFGDDSFVDFQTMKRAPDYREEFHIHKNPAYYDHISDGDYIDECCGKDMRLYPMDAMDRISASNDDISSAHSNISEVAQAVLSLDRDARSTKEAISLLVQKVEKMTEILSEKTSMSASSDRLILKIRLDTSNEFRRTALSKLNLQELHTVIANKLGIETQHISRLVCLPDVQICDDEDVELLSMESSLVVYVRKIK